MTLTSNEYSQLLNFLTQKTSYPHHPEKIEHIQTHISHVFIAGSRVYKIKKPVDLGFLDYSTLPKRKHFCQREIELNRRLCDDTYLGVVTITRKNGSYELNGDGEVVEYAVEMEKLPERYFLHSYIERDDLTYRHLDRVAKTLADFYNRQEPDQQVLKYGQIQQIKFNTDENFDQTQKFVGDTISRLAYDTIQKYTNSYFEVHKSLFERRISQKRIVDGHGDLHLDHIHITPEKVRIYDCIEFNERFRYGDLAADLAYLAMDLDFIGRHTEERYFIQQMVEKLNDPDLPHILDFYKCYRAYVKGKVKSIQSTEEEVEPKDRMAAAEKAVRYFDLSLRYALLGSEPLALIFMGRIGTGKSTLARQLADQLQLEVFSSDQIRKTMAGLPLKQRTPAEQREQIYNQEMSQKTYAEMLRRGINELEQGKSVILDATFSSRNPRSEVVEMLQDKNYQFFFVEAQASDQTIKKRLEDREKDHDLITDARLEDFENLDANYEPPGELTSGQLIRVNTEQPLQQTVASLFNKLLNRHLRAD